MLRQFIIFIHHNLEEHPSSGQTVLSLSSGHFWPGGARKAQGQAALLANETMIAAEERRCRKVDIRSSRMLQVFFIFTPRLRLYPNTVNNFLDSVRCLGSCYDLVLGGLSQLAHVWNWCIGSNRQEKHVETCSGKLMQFVCHLRKSFSSSASVGSRRAPIWGHYNSIQIR